MRRLLALALCVLAAGCGAKQYQIGSRRIRTLPVRQASWRMSPNAKGALTEITVEDFARLAAVDPAIMGQGAGTHVPLHLTQQGAGPQDDLRGFGFLVDTGTYAGLKTQVSTIDPQRFVILPLPAPNDGFFACVPNIKSADTCMLKMKRGDVIVTSTVNPRALHNWSAVVQAYDRVVGQAMVN
jgi:hypothetical protein